MSAAPTRSESPIRAARDRILAADAVVGPELRRRLVAAYDAWLSALVPDGAPVALVAVGGYGRAEPAPYSDLDLVLLHNGAPRRIAAIADDIWYPIWDSGIGLDHAVRTVDETVGQAAADVKVALGVLDVRFIAGAPELAGQARERIAAAWRINAHQRAESLHEMATERIEAFGQVRYLLQPHLKQSYGGLRDATILRALARAQLIDVRREVREALTLLLDVRGEAHRHAGRGVDVLRSQDQAGIATALGMSGGEELLARVSAAGRVIGRACGTAWSRAARRRAESDAPLRARLQRGPRVGRLREGLAKDVVRQGDEVMLARDADPRHDRGLTLRVARAAARATLPVSPFTLDRLRIETPLEPQAPWTAEMRSDLDSLLAAGRPMLRVWEDLDEAGLIERLLPEWSRVRSLAQHNAVHTYTVDRHLLETVLQTRPLTGFVTRPDLLRLGALLHDIGKGQPGDHSVAGAGLAEQIVRRMRLPTEDARTVVTLVRHHLTLATTATRRDLTDARTVAMTSERIGGSPTTIDLLQALTEADAKATGPAAWSRWKAGLVGDLTNRLRAAAHGRRLPTEDTGNELLTAAAEQLSTAAPEIRCAVVLGRGDGAHQRLAIATRGGVPLSAVGGVLSVESLDVRQARVANADDLNLLDVLVEPRFGSMPAAADLTGLIHHAAAGMSLWQRLAAKAASYDPVTPARLELGWFEGEATDATVLEVRTEDRVALLYRLLRAFEASGVLVRSATVATYGPSVVDSFYLTSPDGAPLRSSLRSRVDFEIHRTLGSLPIVG